MCINAFHDWLRQNELHVSKESINPHESASLTDSAGLPCVSHTKEKPKTTYLMDQPV